MALIDKASLLMVPSTYEAGKLYNVLPSGNRAPDSTDQNSGYDQTRADFDFDRGTDHAATRIDENGVLQKYRENVILHSNNFSDGVWPLQFSTITSGQSSYDGSSDAWLLDSNIAGGNIRQGSSISGVNTFSIYAKKGTADGIRIRFDQTTDTNIFIDLRDGSVNAAINDITTSVQNVSGDWYRVSFSMLNAGLGLFRIYPTDGGTNAIAGTIYIQDAQLESGLVATDYLDSTDVTGKAGVLVDMPRINYDANGENGSLLLEPQRANVVPFSEYFGASDWTKTNVAVTNNATTSPEGVQNAALVYPSSSSSTKWGVKIEETKSGLTNSAYTNSVYLKANGWRWVYMIDPSGLKSVWFDLQEGVVGTEEANASGDIEPMGDGWYRCTTYTHASTTTYIYAGVYFSDADNSYVCTASGTNGVYMYGFQSEAGSYPSSYIPNHGESGGVTRAADSCSVTGVSDVIGQTEGTLFFDWVMNHESPNTSEDLYTLSVTDGSGNKMMGVNNYNQTIAVFIKNTTTQFFDNSYTGGADGARIKLGLAYANNDIALYINGAQIATDSSATIPTLNQIRLNTFWNGNLPDSSSVKQLALFKERLSNAKLATLTTL